MAIFRRIEDYDNYMQAHVADGDDDYHDNQMADAADDNDDDDDDDDNHMQEAHMAEVKTGLVAGQVAEGLHCF